MIDILIPMAGRGSRMAELHGTLPKPLIEVRPGKRMIEYVIDSLALPGPHRFLFVCLEEHVTAYGLERFFKARTARHRIVSARKVTRGPACSALLAAPLIDGGDELLIAYCDDYLRLDAAGFLAFARARKADGAMVVYPSRKPTESYVALDASGLVARTAEKEVIGPLATTGLYYFRRGRDFVRAARRMVRRGRGAGAEFFVCPVYNELIAEGRKVLPYRVKAAQYVPLGTPAALSRFRRARATSSR